MKRRIVIERNINFCKLLFFSKKDLKVNKAESDKIIDNKTEKVEIIKLLKILFRKPIDKINWALKLKRPFIKIRKGIKK